MLLLSEILYNSTREDYVGEVFTSFNLCARMCFALCQSEKKLGERAIGTLKTIEKNSQINLIENYGFARDWRTALYKVNSHCIQD